MDGLGSLLCKKRIVLLPDQLTAARQFIDSSPEYLGSSGVHALKQVVEWSCGAINVENESLEFWNVFLDSSRLAGKYYVGPLLTKPSSIVFSVIPGILSNPDSSEQLGVVVQASLESLVGNLAFRPSMKLSVDLFNGIVKRLDGASEAGPEFVVDALGTAIKLLTKLSTTLAPRKFFDSFLKNVFVTSCKIYPILDKKGPAKLLLEDIVVSVLFHKECLDNYSDSCIIWRQAERTHKSKKDTKMVSSFTRFLFETIENLVENGSDSQILSLELFLPFLYESLLSKIEPIEKTIKRKREETNLETKFLIELLDICSLGHRALGVCRGLLRVAIDHDTIDISNELCCQVFSKWLTNQLNSWGNDGEIHRLQADAQVSIVGLMLELDHRMIHPHISKIFEFAYTKLSLLQEQCSELILKVLNTYSRLRQMDVVVPLILASADTKPYIAFKVFYENKTLRDGIGKLFFALPPLHNTCIWNTLLDQLLVSKEGNLVFTEFLLELFILNINVNEHSASKLFHLATATRVAIQPILENCFCICVCLLSRVAGLALMCSRWENAKRINSGKDIEMSSSVPDMLSILERIDNTSPDPSSELHDRYIEAVARLAMLHVTETDTPAYLQLAIKYFAFDIINENLGTICSYSEEPNVGKMLKKFCLKALNDAVLNPNSNSPLVSVSFYEHRAIQDIFGSCILDLSKSIGVDKLPILFQLASSLPRNYLPEYDIKAISKSLFHFAKTDPCLKKVTCSFLACNSPMEFFAGDMKSNLKSLVPEMFENETLIELLCSGLLSAQDGLLYNLFVQNVRESFESGLVSVMDSTLHFLNTSVSFPAHCKEGLLVLEKHGSTFPVSSGEYFTYRALMMKVQGTPSSSVLKLIPEDASSCSQNRLKGMFQFLRVSSQHMESSQVAVNILKRLFQVLQHVQDRSVGKAALRSLFENCDFKEQFPLLLDALVEEIRLLKNLPTMMDTLEILIEVALEDRKRYALFIQKSELIHLLLLSMDETSVKCCDILSMLLMRCKGFWDTNSLQRPRLALDFLLMKFTTTNLPAAFAESLLRLMFNLLKHTQLISKCIAVVISTLIAACSCAFNSKQVWNFTWVPRIVELLVEHPQVAKHHAAYFLAEYLDNTHYAKVPSQLKGCYEQAAFHYLEICSEFELQQTFAISGAGQQAILKTLREDYLNQHKFVGKI